MASNLRFQSKMMYAFLLVPLAISQVVTSPVPSSLEDSTDVNRRAVCVLQSTCNVTGTIEIIQDCPTSPVMISGMIEVSTEIHEPAGMHGFHIHTYGVPTGNCSEAGGHYNPHGQAHGAPTDEIRHVGDLGNIMIKQVNASFYTSSVEIQDSLVSLFGDNSVAGRAIVLHAMEDDLGKGEGDDTLVTGDAGSRMACCTICIAESPIVNPNTK